MKSFGKYISKYFVSFFILVIALALCNLLAFVGTFHKTVSSDYGSLSPHNMLENISAASSSDGITEKAADMLRSYDIWVMFLDDAGHCLWSVELPAEVPANYSIQAVAEFSKGYLCDYPVFVRSREDGLLVLGYPKDSYMKITGNYYPTGVVRVIPFFFAAMLVIDLTVLFLAYYFSRKKIINFTEPIISAVTSLSDGKPISLSVSGELSEIADSINQASRILNRQNQARANWISGVSHDIRTPLSMIMGYSRRIACDDTASETVRKQAEIIKSQSIKIKNLVQDLNLVSQLEYDMQPVHKEKVRLSRLLRSYTAELLSMEASGDYPVEINISPSAETAAFDCDARLITRAVNNLVQNSIHHNPKGCRIILELDCTDISILLTVKDDGIGLSPEKIKELQEKPHYMESMDERLDLRHGLGLILVRQITNVHGGTMHIESEEQHGCKTTLIFPMQIT